MARTAVIAGTATAVSGRVQQRAAAQQSAAPADEAISQQPAAPPADDKISKIRELGKLHADGLLSDEEFTAAKASILGI